VGVIEHLSTNEIEKIKQFYGVNIVDENTLQNIFSKYFRIKVYTIKDSIDIILKSLRIRRIGNKIKIENEIINLDEYNVTLIEISSFSSKGYMIILFNHQKIKLKIKKNNNYIIMESNFYDIDIIERIIYNMFVKQNIKSFRDIEKPLKIYYEEYISPKIKKELQQVARHY